jgi:hypothetical protein
MRGRFASLVTCLTVLGMLSDASGQPPPRQLQATPSPKPVSLDLSRTWGIPQNARSHQRANIALEKRDLEIALIPAENSENSPSYISPNNVQINSSNTMRNWVFFWAYIVLQSKTTPQSRPRYVFIRDPTIADGQRSFLPKDQRATIDLDWPHILHVLVGYYDSEAARYSRNMGEIRLDLQQNSNELRRTTQRSSSSVWTNLEIIDAPQEFGVPLILMCSRREAEVCAKAKQEARASLGRELPGASFTAVEAVQTAREPLVFQTQGSAPVAPAPANTAEEQHARLGEHPAAAPTGSTSPSGLEVPGQPPPAAADVRSTPSQPQSGLVRLYDTDNRIIRNHWARWEASCDNRIPLAQRDLTAAQLSDRSTTAFRRDGVAMDRLACLVISHRPQNNGPIVDRLCLRNLIPNNVLALPLHWLEDARHRCEEQTVTVTLDVRLPRVRDALSSRESRAPNVPQTREAQSLGEWSVARERVALVHNRHQITLRTSEWEAIRQASRTPTALLERLDIRFANQRYSADTVEVGSGSSLTITIRPLFVELRDLRIRGQTANGRPTTNCTARLEVAPPAQFVRSNSPDVIVPNSDINLNLIYRDQQFRSNETMANFTLLWPILSTGHAHPHVKLRFDAPCNALGETVPLELAAFSDQGQRLTLTRPQPSLLVMATTSSELFRTLGVSQEPLQPFWSRLTDLAHRLDEVRTPDFEGWGRNLFIILGTGGTRTRAELRQREAPDNLFRNLDDVRVAADDLRARITSEPLSRMINFRVTSPSGQSELASLLAGRERPEAGLAQLRRSLIVIAGPVLGTSIEVPICSELRESQTLGQWLRQNEIRLLLIDVITPQMASQAGDAFSTPDRAQPFLLRCNLPGNGPVQAFSLSTDGLASGTTAAFNSITREATSFATAP